MRRPARQAIWLTGMVSLLAIRAPAQTWRLRVDANVQRIDFRGLAEDSIPQSAAIGSPDGGLQTLDGYAVNCLGDGWCRFFRNGPIVTGAPASVGIDATVWGLRVTGLSLRINAQARADLSGDSVFIGSAPPLRLIEGFAQYIRDGLTVQLGRMLDRGRLASVGSSGLDGLRATWRSDAGLEVGGYAGWGTARGTVLGVNSPAVDPLADYQLGSRQIVVGALAGAHLRAVDVQAEYRREIDPVTDYIVAERAALSMQARPAMRLSVAAGADYDIAQAAWGSAEATATYNTGRITASLSARHYRPFFDLSTVWGVFSPVPFNGVSASLSVSPISIVQIRSQAEWFRYDAAGVSVPNVPLLDRGWRWALGGTVEPAPEWTAEVSGHGESQPGASSMGVDGRVTWHVRQSLDFSLDGGSMEVPLELRFLDAGTTYAGGSAAYSAGDQWRFNLGIDRYWNANTRPDAASISWNQWRMSARATLTLRSAADRWLPPARPSAGSP